MGAFWQDVRFSLRRLAAQRAFAATVIVTMALAVGANTAVFSVFDALLLRPLPFRDPSGLVQLWRDFPSGGRVSSVGYDALVGWREQRDLFAVFEAFDRRAMVLAGGDEPTQVPVALLTGGLMETLGIRPQLGRGIAAADTVPGASRVIVLSGQLWRTQFGADARVVGRTVRVDEQPFEVVGVMPSAFAFPYSNTRAWVGLVNAAPSQGGPPPRFEVLARLAPGLTLAQAQARLDTLSPAIAPPPPGRDAWAMRVRPFDERRLNPAPRRAMFVLAGAVGLVLLIACANIATLFLARGADRERDYAVQASLGAGRGRLIRTVLIESLVLALVGGTLGVVVAGWSVPALMALAPTELTFLNRNAIGIDARVLSFAVALTTAAGLVFGVVPAVRASRVDVVDVLKAGAGTASQSRQRRRLGHTIVIAEIAVALVLLAGAGLIARTLLHLTRIDPGVRTEGLVDFWIQLPAWKYRTAEAAEHFYADVLTRVRGLPHVDQAMATEGLPPRGGGFHFDLRIEAEGRPGLLDDPSLQLPSANVPAEYFQMLGIPILSGRAFGPADTPSAPPAVIVNESLARRLWPDGTAVGSRMRLDRDEPWFEVVGVSGNVFQFNHRMSGDAYAVYYAASQASQAVRLRHVVVRSAAPTEALAGLVREQIRAVDANQPVPRIETMTQAYADFFAEPRFYARLLGALAFIGLVLGAVGLYGVSAYHTARRGTELGVRMALGAEPSTLAWLVVREGTWLASVGIGIGLVASALAVRPLEALLVGVQPLDPITLGAVATLLWATAVAACAVPARRALRLNPIDALRRE